MTNHLADELRQILTDLDNDPMSGHLEPTTRERLVVLIAHVERLHAEPEPTVELTASGLDPEQEIRARALEAAGRQEPADGWDGIGDLLDTADVFAGYIRTGARP
jgi:hypothetical protein